MEEDISQEDRELAAIATRIRRHRRKSLVAKLAGTGIAFTGLVGSCALAYFSSSLGFVSGRLFWLLAIAGAILGAVVYRYLDPKDDPADAS